MPDIEFQQNALETLQFLNAAVTALRLCPEVTPKVSNAVEKAYQGSKLFVRQNGQLYFGIDGEDLVLCGDPLDSKICENLQLRPLFDHLRNLDLCHVVLRYGFDRRMFKRTLAVLTATRKQVDEAGGGREYVERLRLDDVFPIEYSKEEHVLGGLSSAGTGILQKQQAADIVRPEYINYLLSLNQDAKLGLKLKHIFLLPEKSVPIIAAAITSLLQKMFRKKQFIVSPDFNDILQNANALLAESQRSAVAKAVAAVLADQLEDSCLLILLSQEFQSPFAKGLYAGILFFLDEETLFRLFQWFEARKEKMSDAEIVNKAKVQVIFSAYANLMGSERGKQFVSEKVNSEIVEKGEPGLSDPVLDSGIEALLEGNIERMRNNEVLLQLPEIVERLLDGGEDNKAAAIVQNLANGLRNGDDILRMHLGQSLSLLAIKLVSLKRWEWLEKLAPVCLAWIRESDQADQSYLNFANSLQKVMSHSWKVGDLDLGEKILNVFYYIRSGSLVKSAPIRALIGRIQDEAVDTELLLESLKECYSNPVKDMICQKMSMQGPVAARFLLDTLLGTENRKERIRLLQILSGMGGQLLPVLLERLHDSLPWYGTRNVVRLLAESGGEKNVDTLLRLIRHDDLRVQREVVSCIYKISGTRRKEYLLHILPLVNMQFQAHIVKVLSRYIDDEVVTILLVMLDDLDIDSAQEVSLVVEICNTLGRSGYSRALPALATLGSNSEAMISEAAGQAVELICFKLQDNKKNTTACAAQEMEYEVVQAQDTETAQDSSLGFELITEYPEEVEVYKLLQQDKKEVAIQGLMSLVRKTAKLRQFSLAEQLRERLMEIDSMALADIIKAAEVIEEEKSASIDGNHIAIWTELYDLLTTEEFNVLYHSLEHTRYTPEKPIVNQGNIVKMLFFINHGRVKLFYRKNGNDILVKTMGPGQVLGASSFFDASVWTVDAASIGTADVSILRLEKVAEWKEEFPALESKLRDFCEQFDTVEEFFKTGGVDRRKCKRFNLEGRVKTELLNDEGRKAEHSLQGDIVDISSCGVSFYVRISNKKHVRMLLGRKIRVKVSHAAIPGLKTGVVGVIVAVHAHQAMASEHSVHVEFDEVLDPGVLGDMVQGERG